MKTMNKKIVFLPLILVFISLTFALSVGLVSAIPGIPHQFYGSVTVNSKPAPDNNIITAIIEGDSYLTVTTNGKYGYSPNIFYVEDPDGDRRGELIQFFVGGKKAGSYVFENNGYTKLDFDLTTTCGDGYCLGDESCSNCEKDCGICTEPPVITITSPENKVYDTTKIDLKVSADQTILIWMYNLNNAGPVVFSPDITLTLNEGNYNLDVIGLNKAYQSGKSSVSFSIKLPSCGNGICSVDESCSSCPADCGSCSSGGGGGGGGSGGSSAKTSTTTGAAVTSTTPTTTTETESSEEESITTQTTPTEQQGFFARITGAVTGTLGKAGTIGAFIFVIIIIAVAISIAVIRKKEK